MRRIGEKIPPVEKEDRLGDDLAITLGILRTVRQMSQGELAEAAGPPGVISRPHAGESPAMVGLPGSPLRVSKGSNPGQTWLRSEGLRRRSAAWRSRRRAGTLCCSWADGGRGKTMLARCLLSSPRRPGVGRGRRPLHPGRSPAAPIRASASPSSSGLPEDRERRASPTGESSFR
jgi:hypothetical protein